MNSLAKPLWSMLVISLPGRSATPRMRIWRALKGLGAVVLRDGVYLLPHSESAARSLREQAEAVIASGGDAHVLTFTSTGQQQAEHFANYLIAPPITRGLSRRSGRINPVLRRSAPNRFRAT